MPSLGLCLVNMSPGYRYDLHVGDVMQSQATPASPSDSIIDTGFATTNAYGSVDVWLEVTYHRGPRHYNYTILVELLHM